MSVTDNFNRVENPLAVDWTTVAGMGSAAATGTVWQANGIPAGTRWSSAAFDDNQYAQCRALNLIGGSAGPAVRLQEGAASGYVLGLAAASQRIIRLDAGEPTQLGDEFAEALTSASVCRLKIVGTTLGFYVDGLLIGQRNDATHGSGSPGIAALNEGDTFDDFEAADAEPDPIILQPSFPAEDREGMFIELVRQRQRTRAARFLIERVVQCPWPASDPGPAETVWPIPPAADDLPRRRRRLPDDQIVQCPWPASDPGPAEIIYPRRVLIDEPLRPRRPAPPPDYLVYAPYRKGVPTSRYYADFRGLYRVFNDAEYRFYRSASGPPAETDTPFATNATLPHTPANTYADGTWYLSVSYFNGVLDSGFLPLGSAGETYLRLDLASGVLTGSPPQGPLDWRLEVRAGGVVRILAVAYESGANRPDQWAIAYSTDGSTPAADDPDLTSALPTSGAAALSYDLSAAGNGTSVKVRLQTRRNDGTTEVPAWVYSAGSTVKTTTADAAGPTAPTGGVVWPAPLSEAT